MYFLPNAIIQKNTQVATSLHFLYKKFALMLHIGVTCIYVMLDIFTKSAQWVASYFKGGSVETISSYLNFMDDT